MAEAVVNIVLTKLTDAVLQKALSLYEVGDKIESLQHELKWIQAFVKDADSKRHKNNRVKCWVNEVQEVSYLIDDTLEEFLIKVGGTEGTLKKIGKIPMKLYYKNKLGAKIDKILKRLNEISANTTKYKIEGLDDSSTVASSDLFVRPLVIPGLDETEVVGFEDDMEAIFKQLIDANVVRRSVISIVGAGGFGKTTLAKKIYERTEVRSHFAISLWVTVSEEYKLKDLLIKILEGMGESNSEMWKKGEDQLITEIYNCIKERTYLVVLDDVWSADLWTQLQVALPKANNGSRVLITTRFINIAEEADAVSKPYKIKPLNEEKSQQLLLKQIFPNQYTNECPEVLLALAPQFVKKCGGCPLALVVLGGFLSRKCPTYNAWDDVMRNMDWHTDGSKCMGVLSTSFNNLPIHLKTCFMYFATFPEDYQIKASTLIQLWIAEGFIPHDTSRIMEDIAEHYLEELVQRCMVQVSRRSIRGKIKYCQIHDLLREVAIKKAKEDNFLTVFSKNDTHSVSCFTPRVSLNNCGNVPLEHTTTNLRTVNYFGGCVMRNWKRFGMLRVLNLMDDDFLRELISVSNKKDEINWLKDLTALRYFGEDFWSKCHEDDGAILRLSYLSRMKNLQTVNIKCLCKRDELPMSLWENKVLRHVKIKYPCGSCGGRPEGPPSSADLQNLLTLKGVFARQEWSKKLPHFPHLRKLKMGIPKCVDAEAIINSVLSNLQDLGSLSLSCEFYNMVPIPCCYAASAFRSHQRLHSFSQIGGIWPKQTSLDYGSMFPPHLLKLKLQYFSFEEDPMPHLEKLPNLTVLALDRGLLMAADGNKRITCSRRGFGRLQELALGIFGLEEWKIEEGAMPQLNKLQLESYHLKTVPDLQYLTNLRELKVFNADEEFKSKMQGDDQEKIKHIPSVTIW